MSSTPRPDDLLKPGEIAPLFRVGVKTVSRWAKSGKVPSVRTPGGQVRIRRDVIDALLRGQTPGGAL
jgi:excisionase family DNA binding protein